MRNSTALLPVGNCFFNKVKLNLEEIASIWAPCMVQVMERTKPDGKTTTVFVVGSGHGGYDRNLSVRHDQTRAYLGEYAQFGEVQLDKDGKVSKMVMGDRPMPKTAPVHVYK